MANESKFDIRFVPFLHSFRQPAAPATFMTHGPVLSPENHPDKWHNLYEFLSNVRKVESCSEGPVHGDSLKFFFLLTYSDKLNLASKVRTIKNYLLHRASSVCEWLRSQGRSTTRMTY